MLPWSAGACITIMLVIDFPLHELYNPNFYTQSLGYSVQAIGYAAILLLAYHSDSSNGVMAKDLRRPLLTQCGRYSYGMYVFHMFVLLGLTYLFGGRPWFGHSLSRALAIYILFNAVCFAIAFLSYNLYEKHFLRLKQRMEPARRDPATAPGGFPYSANSVG